MIANRYLDSIPSEEELELLSSSSAGDLATPAQAAALNKFNFGPSGALDRPHSWTRLPYGWQYKDDDVGRLLTETTPAGRTTEYEYDALGRLTLTDLPDGEVARSYDSVGQLLNVNYSDSTPDLSYTYDKAGRVESATNGVVESE